MKWTALCVGAAVGLCALLSDVLPAAAAKTPAKRTKHFQLILGKAKAHLKGKHLEVKVPWRGTTPGGKLVLKVLDLKGRSRSSHTTVLGPSSSLSSSLTFSFRLPASARRKVDLLRLSYRHVAQRKAPLPSRRLKTLFITKGIAALSEILDRHFVWVRGHDSLIAGGTAGLRVIVRDPKGKNFKGMKITLTLRRGAAVVRTSGRTDTSGSARLTLKVPARWGNKSARLTVRTSGSFVQRVTHKVQIQHRIRTLLTTNKPIYQPGQTMWIRLLALRAPKRRPHANSPVAIDILDGNGNKVFRKETRTDGYGVAWARFQLADRVCHGWYTVRSSVKVPNGDDIDDSRRVKVYRYKLPKFKVRLEPTRSYLTPGERLEATLKAKYLTGKPVPGARIKIVAERSDAYRPFRVLAARTDRNGAYTVRIPLARNFLKKSSEATIYLKAAVTEPGGQRRIKHIKIPVLKRPIRLAAIAETGAVIPGIPQKIYVVAAYPGKKPARARLVIKVVPPTRSSSRKRPALKPLPQVFKISTDAYGIAEFTVTPKTSTLRLEISAKDSRGRHGFAKQTMWGSYRRGDFIIRPTKAIYRGNETMVVDVFSRARWGAVYLDVVQNDQTVRTEAGVVRNGRARLRIPLAADMEGTLRLSAYQLSAAGTYSQTFRKVLVQPHRKLNVSVRQDRNVYRPGQPARLSIQVKDERGRPAPAMLGVEITDSAVYALAGSPPELRQMVFMLESELLDKKLQINGVRPSHLMAYAIDPQKQRAAQVLMAMRSARVSYNLKRNGMQSYLSYRTALSRRLKAGLKARFRRRFKTYSKAFHRYWRNRFIKERCKTFPELVSLPDLIKARFLASGLDVDPWGRALWWEGRDFCGCFDKFNQVYIHSLGPDGKSNTQDDLSFGPYRLGRPKRPRWIKGCLGGWGCGCGFGGGGGGIGRFRSAGVRVMMGRASVRRLGDGVRSFFPEALYVNPTLRTDAAGRAKINLKMADSITTWVMTSFASDKTGRLGSLTHRVKVFKEFFVDVNLPQALTRLDEVEIPVAVHNHLKRTQKVHLRLMPAAWFALKKGSSRKMLTVPAGSVSVARFTIKALKVGRWKLTVRAASQAGYDAIARKVDVRPEGRKISSTRSGTLSGLLATTAEIPSSAVPGSEELTVKIQPEPLSVVMDGLDGLLRRPYGCFEQTSSTTYPNIMVLSYLKRTRKTKPDLKKKALKFIGMGYQRLLSFEVSRRGFSLFGNAPANPILSAYGLQEFHDMSKVRYVDRDVLRRTRRFLTSTQHADGSWHKVGGLIESGATNARGRVMATAYIAWALARTGLARRAVKRALRYLKHHADGAGNDPYALALIANVAAHAGGRSHRSFLHRVLNRIAALKRTDKQGNVFWTTQTSRRTVMSGYGASAMVETTALVLEALLKTRRHLDLARKGIKFLLAKKDPKGAWYTTQATVLSLRALLKAKSVFADSLPPAIDVYLDGKLKETVTLNPKDVGVTHLVDLSTGLKPGKHNIRIQPRGKGSVLYQVAHAYNAPDSAAAKLASPAPKGLRIRTRYSRTRVKVDETVFAGVKLHNLTRRTLSAPVAELGVPPGFDLDTDDLDRLVRSRKIQRYEIKPRRLVLYFTKLTKRLTALTYRLQARRPARVTVPGSTFYEYYTPEKRAYTRDQRLSAVR